MTNAEKFLQSMKDAIALAESFDAQQQHEEAAIVLKTALHTGGAWDGQEDPILLEIAEVAQACGRERDRQELKALRLI